MKFVIVSPGKIKEKLLLEKVERFAKIISKPFSIEFDWFNKKKNKFKEIIDQKKQNEFIIKCEEWGSELTSLEFYDFIDKKRSCGISKIFFFIGDAEGYGEFGNIKGDFSLSLSKMTFPHDIARMLLSEQLYRVSTIEKGSSYHK